jgi:hypothetical protein
MGTTPILKRIPNKTRNTAEYVAIDNNSEVSDIV